MELFPNDLMQISWHKCVEFYMEGIAKNTMIFKGLTGTIVLKHDRRDGHYSSIKSTGVTLFGGTILTLLLQHSRLMCQNNVQITFFVNFSILLSLWSHQ